MYKYNAIIILELKSLKDKGEKHRIDTNILLDKPILKQEDADYVIDYLVADNIKRKTIKEKDIIDYYGMVVGGEKVVNFK